MKKGVITLYIDPDAYKSASGHPLDEETLYDQGQQANADAAGMWGYEGWNTQMCDLVDKETKDFLPKADVVIPLERKGGLSATEVLATRSWFERRNSDLSGLTELRERVIEIHAILKPEDYPRSVQPDHTYWDQDDAGEPGSIYEWNSGTTNAVNEALERLISSFSQRPIASGTFVPDEHMGLVVELLKFELENAIEDENDAATNAPYRQGEAHLRVQDAKNALNAIAIANRPRGSHV